MGHVNLVVSPPQQQQSTEMITFSASAANALDVYYKFRIIYLCNEKDDSQIVSLNITQDGITLMNYGANIMNDESLPSNIHLPRSMFKMYQLHLPSNTTDMQVLINFTTLMDFLDCTLCNESEDLVVPLNIMYDKWLYISLQRVPTICDLGSAIGSPVTQHSERFCFVPGDFVGAIADAPQTVPTSPPQLEDNDSEMRPPTGMNGVHVADQKNDKDDVLDHIILMLHPLSLPHCEEFSLVPTRKTDRTHSVLSVTHAAPVPASVSSPTSDDSGSEKRPKKRLKTTSAQVAYMEEWFKKDPLPSRSQREIMVQHMGGIISLRQVEVWFQNRRAKYKKAHVVTPPTLVPGSPPPTTPPSQVKMSKVPLPSNNSKVLVAGSSAL